MRVLIAFITTHDPWEDEEKGPAQAITAAKALEPKFIHLLYTDSTKSNFEATREFLEENLSHSKVFEHKLDLTDTTDYQRLKDVLPNVLKDIRRQHPGGNFYLVSGQPQPRFIFSLCVFSQVLNGAILEVLRPDINDPWPATSEGYEKRLKELDLSFFTYFRELFLEQYKKVRLKLRIDTEEVWLDDKRLDFRARLSESEKEYIQKPRTFQTMVLLAAKKLYGGNNDKISKRELKKLVYDDTMADINIPRAIQSINKQAAKVTKSSSVPLNPLIIQSGGGIYQLTDRLNPAEESIEITGDLKSYLKKILKKMDVSQELFPYLQF